MKTTRLNQLYEHADHGDLLPYQEAELRYLEKREGNFNFKKLIFTLCIIAGILFFLTKYFFNL